MNAAARHELIARLSPAAQWFANHACDECREPSRYGYCAEATERLRAFTDDDIEVYGSLPYYSPELIRRTVEEARTLGHFW